MIDSVREAYVAKYALDKFYSDIEATDIGALREEGRKKFDKWYVGELNKAQERAFSWGAEVGEHCGMTGDPVNNPYRQELRNSRGSSY